MQYRTSVRKNGSAINPVEYNLSHILSSRYTLETRRINDVKGYFVLFPEASWNEEVAFDSVTTRDLKLNFFGNSPILKSFFGAKSGSIFSGYLGLVLNEDFEIKGISYDGNSSHRLPAITEKMNKLAVVHKAEKFEELTNQVETPYDYYQEEEFNNILLEELCVFGNICNMIGHWQADSVRQRINLNIIKAKKIVMDILAAPLAESIFGANYLKLKANDAMIYLPEDPDKSAFHLIGNSWVKLERLIILNFIIAITDVHYSLVVYADLINKQFLHDLTVFDLIKKHVDVADAILTLPTTEGLWKSYKNIQQRLLNNS